MSSNKYMANKRKILIVEDEIPLVKALEGKFARAGFAVEVALDGIEALKKLKTSKPDLILLDMLLPRMDGFEFLEKLKKDKDLKDIPVVIFSNLTQESDMERGLSLGALEYIDKSKITIKGLVDKVGKYLNI